MTSGARVAPGIDPRLHHCSPHELVPLDPQRDAIRCSGCGRRWDRGRFDNPDLYWVSEVEFGPWVTDGDGYRNVATGERRLGRRQALAAAAP